VATLSLLLLGGPCAPSHAKEKPPRVLESQVTEDDQYAPVVRTPLTKDPVDKDGRRELKLRGEFGRGLLFSTLNNSFAVQLRLRAQLQLSVSGQGSLDQLGAEVRRLRVLFGGHGLNGLITFYVQLGFSDRGIEADQPVPLRDAFATLHLARFFNLRIGQMKVPYDRQRLNSSSKLQLVERSRVTNRLNLDRDIGIQIYGSLPGRLTYYVGLFAGDGRNRINRGLGWLYVGRLRLSPFGDFDDGHETDLARTHRLRLAVSISGAWNHQSRRVNSTQGAFLSQGSIDYLHAAFDVMLKYAGWSLMAEAMVRKATYFQGGADQSAQSDGISPSIWGGFVQTGFLFAFPIELALRVGGMRAFHQVTHDFEELELTGGLGWLVLRHDLKLQASYTSVLQRPRVEHIVRIQTQFFF
jgi:hypothetical protein